MMEEEIRIGEQEREQLRIEAQRLREELSDLKIEAEILQDKLKQNGDRHNSTTLTDFSALESPMFDCSIVSGAISGASSPLISTPPESSSVTSSKTPANEPPSPPMSDASAPPPLPKVRVPPIKTPAPTSRPKKSRLPSMDTSTTPRPRLSSTASSRAPTRSSASTATRSAAPPPRSTATKPPTRGQPKLAPSTSLSHIRSLTAQMQRLEARVHSARSKLPGPNPTPPRASPRGTLMNSTNVTVRTRRRGPGSVSSVATSTTNEDSTPTGQQFNRSMNGGNHVPRLSSSGVSRLSFGPLPNRGPTDPSEISRPSSRASTSSYARPLSRAGTHNDSMIAPPRPGSRAGGAYTPLGRPISRASFGNSFHGHSMSFSTAEEDEPEEAETLYRTPSRRNTYSRTGIPTPTGLPVPSSRRQSLASVASDVSQIRRPSITVTKSAKKPPRTSSVDLGETY